MDSLTHIVLGAAIGEAVLGKRIGRKAAILGAVVNTIPDLDVLFTPFFDELQRISIHRGFSHSILFSICGAFLLAYLFQKFKWTKSIAYRRLLLFSFLGLFTHITLDSFTGYGTQLFLPFSDWRISFDTISIIDPFFTLPILIGIVGALFKEKNIRQRKWWNYTGLLVSCSYLVFTLYNKQRVEQVFTQNFKEKNIQFEKMLSIPVSFGNLLWYGVGKTEEGLFIGDYSIFDNSKEVKFDFFPTNEKLLDGINPMIVDRMKWFSQDFYTVAEKDGKIHFYNMQCDMQGVKTYGDYKAPTAFFFEIEPKDNMDYTLSAGMHHVGGDLKTKWNRIFGKNN